MDHETGTTVKFLSQSVGDLADRIHKGEIRLDTLERNLLQTEGDVRALGWLWLAVVICIIFL